MQQNVIQTSYIKPAPHKTGFKYRYTFKPFHFFYTLFYYIYFINNRGNIFKHQTPQPISASSDCIYRQAHKVYNI